jgi:hypothetical protein
MERPAKPRQLIEGARIRSELKGLDIILASTVGIFRQPGAPQVYDAELHSGEPSAKAKKYGKPDNRSRKGRRAKRRARGRNRALAV